jgi:hypothetical protein
MKNKSILVIDTPKNCHDCPIIDYCHNNDGKCNLLIRQDWCPLTPLPEKISLHKFIGKSAFDNNMATMMARQYTQGYNSCLDDILKGNTND